MERLELDLANTAVFLDFDGTISTADVGMHLLERTGAPEWLGAARRSTSGARSAAGSASSTSGPGRGRRGRRCARSRPRCRSTPDFAAPGRRRCAPPAPRSPWCRTGSASTSTTPARRSGVDVLTNAVDFSTGELAVPARGPVLPVLDRVASCKQAPIKDAQYRGPHDGAGRRRRQRPQGGAARRRRVRQGTARVVVRRVRRRVHTVRDARRRAPDAARMKVAFGTDERTSLTDAVRATSRRVATTSSQPAEGEWAAVGARVGELVASGECATGVLFCWTGTGASIAANKVRGVRAALCTDAATAAGARRVERRQRARDGLHGPGDARTQWRASSTPGSAPRRSRRRRSRSPDWSGGSRAAQAGNSEPAWCRTVSTRRRDPRAAGRAPSHRVTGRSGPV